MKSSRSKKPLISIIIPSLNQEKYLSEAFESIFRQNYSRLEVIVIDGGSTDNSVDIIKSYQDRLTYWHSKPDGGQAAAINEGAARCSGEIIAWLNSDDFYCEDALLRIAHAHTTHPGHGLYIGNGFRYFQHDMRFEPFCRRHLSFNRKALRFGIDYILQPAVFFSRNAWLEAGGLNPDLNYCMDWDILIRIADQHPVVLINEFLAVSREYPQTKTSHGGLERAMEITRMVRDHTKQELTAGGLFFLYETLLDITRNSELSYLRPNIYEGMLAISQSFSREYGNSDGFPEFTDKHDKIYMPFAGADAGRFFSGLETAQMPSISIITPSFNQARYLSQSLESIIHQNYPKLETIVFDAGSDDGSVDILREYEEHLTYWTSEPDRGPAHAINKGFERATGEILGWLNSDDMLACGALREVGRAFAKDPDLDMVFANALYIDPSNNLFPAHHGTHRTGLYYGEMQPKEVVPAYWRYVHAIPQPTVFFRRRLLDSCGHLNEQYQYIFDFELFFRFAWQAKIKKIEKTLAFYRIHGDAKTQNWKQFEIELYRFSRPWWPKLRSREFKTTFRDFFSSFMERNFSGLSRGLRYWGISTLVKFFVLTRMGNPEKFHALLTHFTSTDNSPVSPSLPPSSNDATVENGPGITGKYPEYGEIVIDRKNPRYDAIFCSYIWPRHPGYSGGEIRDFHLIRHMLKFCAIDFFPLYEKPVRG